LAAMPAAMWLAAMAFYGVIPDNWYRQSRVHPVISARQMSMMRISFITILLCGIAWGTFLTGAPVAVYFLLLWVVPILTSFSFFMVLRQLVQHGNADRGRLTNTRTFFVHPFVQFAVFPLGQDYHLPHHLFATVPHYRLKRLHEFLLQYPEYQEEGVVVEGYIWPPRKSQDSRINTMDETAARNPTVVEVVGPDYHAEEGNPIYIDHSVLEQAEVEDAELVRAAS
jgi:fatty acid desaturase